MAINREVQLNSIVLDMKLTSIEVDECTMKRVLVENGTSKDVFSYCSLNGMDEQQYYIVFWNKLKFVAINGGAQPHNDRNVMMITRRTNCSNCTKITVEFMVSNGIEIDVAHWMNDELEEETSRFFEFAWMEFGEMRNLYKDGRRWGEEFLNLTNRCKLWGEFCIPTLWAYRLWASLLPF